MKQLKLPTNEGWIVEYKDENGKWIPTDYIYKSKKKAQEKADELMLEEQKEYTITECMF